MADDEHNVVAIPVEQASVPFYERDIVAVRLADGRIGAVVSLICDGLGLQPHGQVRRIRADPVLADQLLLAQIETAGGPQAMDVLTAWAIPTWLQGISLPRVAPEKRPAILAFKREAADVLYRHFAQRGALPTPSSLVPAEPLARPAAPAPDAPVADWLEYHRQMVAWLEWQADIEQWRSGVEQRLQTLEAGISLLPDILERLGPAPSRPNSSAPCRRA